MRYFLELAFNGASFHGWQIQPNAVSVQETLERALGILLQAKVDITGAGRTDSGVHARRMFAHFDSDREIEDLARFTLSLNSLVGKDIAIYKIIPVEADSHARFDASERIYKYFVSYKKNPFLYPFCWFSSGSLDLELMNEAASLLYDTKDFTSFAKLHSDAKTNICEVRLAEWKELHEDKEALDFMGNLNEGMVFTISADRFLRNMVRAIVGTLVDVGRHKLTVSGFSEIIAHKNRCAAGTSMPANGLFLWDVKYPFIN